MSQSRQLAAIMFTDIVGYTALMGEDEEKAFELLEKNRLVQRPIIEEHNGRWLKEIGDGVLASFTTVSDAVYCAKAIQEACLLEDKLKLRIGIHQGEVVFKGEDVFGDGVNIASRLEPLAPIGGILVSESVHRNLGNKKNIESTFLREEQLKNVKEPIRIYSIQVEGAERVTIPEFSGAPPQALKKSWIPRKISFVVVGVLIVLLVSYFLYSNFRVGHAPESSGTPLDKSIVVLPFTNMSSDPEQEYFSDGMMEEILNHLVKINDLKVISRTTAMQYKSTAKSVSEITDELNVATALEGSVRKEGNQIRITVQLIDGDTDTHLWSETYDRELTNIFDVQSDVAQQIAQVLKAQISPETKLIIESQPTANSEAYLIYLRARQKLNLRGEANLLEAEKLFEQAIEFDSSFDLTYSGLGRTLTLLPYFSNRYSGNQVVETARIAAKKAITLNPNNSEAYIVLGNIAFYKWDWSEADTTLKKALIIDPNNSEVFNILGDHYIITGNLDKALEMESTALELDPLHAVNHHDLGMVYGAIGDWESALKYATSAMDMNLDFGRNESLLFRSYLELGHFEKAEKMADELEGDVKLIAKARIAVASGKKEEARSYVEEINSEIGNIELAKLYLTLDMHDEAVYSLTKSYNSRNHALLGQFFDISPNHPAVKSAINEVPEVTELFEIISRNLSKLNEKSFLFE